MATNSFSRKEARDMSMMAWRVHEFGAPETMQFERVPVPSSEGYGEFRELFADKGESL